ncbi:MAG: type II secretion system F family protein [Lachnospiraceae bacterium]|nr:type II secretion system F family protein [Lachnospiraceae bacterium]
MALYKYKARDKDGRRVSGKMEAVDEIQLHNKLREKDLFLVYYDRKGNSGSMKRLKSKQTAEFCRSVGTLLAAGVSLVRALSIVSKEETNTPEQMKLYEAVLRSVRQGNPMSEAMQEQGDAFPVLLIYMARSAEAGGNMDKVMLRMADHFEKDARLKSKVISSMIYPCILAVLIVAVMLIIFTFVIPQFESLFERMDSLPLSTRIVMGFSDGLKAYWIQILLVLFFCVVLLSFIKNRPAVKLWWDRLKVHLPVFGKLLKSIYTARFGRTLSSLYAAGLPIITALQVSRSTVGNSYIESQFDKVISLVRAGGTLSDGLDQVDGFNRKLAASIRVGEETGSLDSMLDSIADTLDYEAEQAMNRMVTFIEPAMLVVMAVIVGFMIISVIQPIYGSYNAIEYSAYE